MSFHGSCFALYSVGAGGTYLEGEEAGRLQLVIENKQYHKCASSFHTNQTLGFKV